MFRDLKDFLMLWIKHLKSKVLKPDAHNSKSPKIFYPTNLTKLTLQEKLFLATKKVVAKNVFVATT